MTTHEEATPFVGDVTAHWCPHCLKSTLMKAAIHILVSTGPRRIGEWAVCEECGYSPYEIDPAVVAAALTRHDQEHGHYEEDT